MQGWFLLLGLSAVLAALALAGGEAVIAQHAAPANAQWAGELFTIPLAASVRL